MKAGTEPGGGMTAGQAAALEWSIIGLCIAALVMIFQPFSLTLYGVGAGLAVLGGLAFNLVPLCRAGTRFSTVAKVGLIVFGILLVVVALSIGAALLYGEYVKAQQGG